MIRWPYAGGDVELRDSIVIMLEQKCLRQGKMNIFVDVCIVIFNP